jgi:outer membrane lipoprotein-sorting protein
VTGTIETVLPNTSHTVITSNGESFESISVDGKSYIKLAGVWQEEPDVAGLATPESGSDIVSSLTTPESTDEKITKTGEETVDGVATDVYQDKSDDGTVTTISIGQKDHLPRKAVTVGTDGTRTEVDFSDYNANFDIKAPI